MPERNYDREQRWNSTGPWTDRDENDNREGDRSRARNYDRGDQRRYGRQSQEQAERLRRLRNQGSDPRDREGRNPGDTSGYGERELYRGYGTQVARNEGRFNDQDRQSDRSRDRDSNRGGDQFQDRNQHRGNYDDDYDYDFERDYRNNENMGRDMNLEGQGDPGRQQRDPYRNRGSYGYSGEDRSVEDESSWRDEQNRARDRYYDERGQSRAGGRGDRQSGERKSADRQSGDRGQDRQDNYWGAREQERRSNRDRPDYTSARSVGSSGRNDAWDEGDDRDYDMDPGYQYEFGTDFDFMRDTSLDDARRRQSQRDQERGRENRQQGNRQQQGGWQQQGRQGERDRGRQEYGQQRGQQNQRGSWNVPGPYSGMGPSGYKRTDERIQDEICEIFTNHGQLDATGIEIEVKEGQVTLTGGVNRKNEKYLAEDLAAQVSGVQDVENRIRVQAGEGTRGRDMSRDSAASPGRIQSGMRVAGVDGKHIGKVKETREDGFIIERAEGGDAYIPYRAVKRTNEQVFLHVAGGDVDRQGWKEQ